jgi:heptosyltransferase-2
MQFLGNAGMNQKFKKILVIRFSSLGDLVLLTPLLDRLREWMPKAEIHLLTKERYAPLFTADHRIDEMKLLRTGTLGGLLHLRSGLIAEKYDLILDAHNVIRSNLLYATIHAGIKVQLRKGQLKKFMLMKMGLNLYDEIIHQSERYIDLLHPFDHPEGDSIPSLIIPNETRETARAMIRDHYPEETPLVALAPGARWETKMWPVEHFITVADSLTAAGHGIVLIGGSDDKTLCGELSKRCTARPLDASGRLGLLESAALLAECRLLVTNDSAPLHMAEAVGTSVVALFGPTVREFGYHPQLSSSVMLGLELGCRPCSRNGARPCHLHTNECLVDLSPGHVLEAAGTVLGTSRPTESTGSRYQLSAEMTDAGDRQNPDSSMPEDERPDESEKN